MVWVFQVNLKSQKDYNMEYRIHSISLHYAGNKALGEKLALSSEPLVINEEMNMMLAEFFMNPFKVDEFFYFHHDEESHKNQVYEMVNEIFSGPECMHDQSLNLAKYLYEKSINPDINGGEFYTVYFKDIEMNGEPTDAVGLFKTENKENFLKISHKENHFNIDTEQGISLRKPDKGCLIFNIEKEEGYIVSVYDFTGKGANSLHWIDEFLQLRQRQDEFFNTQNVLTMCKNFVTQELPQHFEVNRADQADLLNKSVKFFKENEQFSLDEFTGAVMKQEEIIDTFSQYRDTFQKENDIEIANNFNISQSAVKRQAKIFKSVIKLDKNFHIYIHGNREMVEQGLDERGRKYYKLYYENEN